MRAAVIEKPFSIGLKEVSEPVITHANEVKIQVIVTGICGSEIHAYHGTHPFRIPPVISGHELAGVVVEIGSEVKDVSVGDRITVEPHYGCGVCKQCQAGNYNICKEKSVLGTQEWIGSFGEFIVVPENTIVKLPDNVSYEQGALIEPLAVGVHAVRKAGIGQGDKVAILGAGPIGLGLLVATKNSGATKIFITDALEYNLNIAKKLGATSPINTTYEDAVERILEETDGEGVDTVFIAVGVQSVLNDSFKIVKRGGKVSEVALFGKKPEIDISYIQNKEIQLIGSNMYVRDDFEIAAEAIAANSFDTSLFISKIVPIEDVKDAMNMVDQKSENVVKVLLKF
ncbi:sorbitol dehydrogenase [Neobacillus bataviensis LMG 21833]|uniref:Sorbitol dehydrogenase n=1 Tax=Neobacillus bataviensis LMG 21833 TaxID=1117379 RepID=K6E085_9BACI|nr:alcohol dehydrogenase catalytic domain-containing protein [Neobacillus bataviensis]EKN66546.1 sorbitol dehydrogenase [Neobacillus bataviensis LMG 21833]